MMVTGAIIARFNLNSGVDRRYWCRFMNGHQFQHIGDIGVDFAQTGGDIFPVADNAAEALRHGVVYGIDDGIFKEFVDLRRTLASRALPRRVNHRSRPFQFVQ